MDVCFFVKIERMYHVVYVDERNKNRCLYKKLSLLEPFAGKDIT